MLTYDPHSSNRSQKARLLLFFSFLGTIISIVYAHGFYLSDLQEVLARICLFLGMILFITHTWLQTIWASNKLAHLKSHAITLVIALLCIIFLSFGIYSFSFPSLITPSEDPVLYFITKNYLTTAEILILIAFIPLMARFLRKLISRASNPNSLLAISFAVLIAIGTGIFMLPKISSHGDGMSLIDAFFMSASALCVTGLTVLDVSQDLSYIGQWALLILIQVGGLGIMTLTTLFLSTISIGGYGLKERFNMKEALGEVNLSSIRSTIFRIVSFTFIIEAIGAFFIFLSIEESDFDQKVFFSIFHAISSFCNAGFTLTSENAAALIFLNHPSTLLCISLLVTVGGIGFPVLSEIFRYAITWRHNTLTKRLSPHSKLSLITSGVLILIGAIGLFIFESSRDMESMSFVDKVLHSLFHSVSARTAGFNSLDIASFSKSSLCIIAALMWIGASPNSTGGGIKTTTFAIGLLNAFRVSTGREEIHVFRQTISEKTVQRAFTAMLVSITYIGLTTFSMSISEDESGFAFEEILFEIISAVSTVGLSLGITEDLSSPGKAIIATSMYIGRVGFLTFISWISGRTVKKKYQYIQANVTIS